MWSKLYILFGSRVPELKEEALMSFNLFPDSLPSISLPTASMITLTSE